MERFSVGTVVTAGIVLGARCLVRFAPVIVVAFAPAVLAAAFGVKGWALAAMALLEVPVAAIVAHAVVGELRGKPVGVAASVRAGLRRTPHALALTAIVLVVVAALGIALVLPAAGSLNATAGLAMLTAWGLVIVALYSRWFVMIPAIVLERPGAVGALARSSKLTEARRMQVASIVLVVAALFVGATLVVELVARSSRSGWFFERTTTPAVAAAGAALWALLAVFRAALSAAAYHYLRRDREAGSPEELDAVFT